MTKTRLVPSGAPAPVGPYSPAIEAGGFVFCSGQIGMDPSTGELAEGLEAQTDRALRNLSAVLDAAGLTLADVVKTTCFLVDMEDYGRFNTAYGRAFPDPAPARSTFAVAALPRGARVEIEAVAVSRRP